MNGSSLQLKYAPYYLLPLIFFLVGPYSVTDSTMWIAWGRLIIEQGTLYAKDTYSILETRPLIFSSWLPSLLYYAVDKCCGLRALMHFHHLLIFPLMGIIYKFTPIEYFTQRKRWIPYFVWFGMVPAFSERPAFLALIPLVLFYNLFDSDCWTKKKILILSLLMILWANLHGTFILMPLMVLWRAVCDLIGGEKKNVAKTFALAFWFFLLGFINPFTYKNYQFVYETFVYSKERGITEWGSYQFFGHFPQLQLWIILWALTLFLLWERGKVHGLQKLLADPFIFLMLLGFTGFRSTMLPFFVFLNFLSRHSLIEAPDSSGSEAKLNYLPATIFLSVLTLAILPPFKKWTAKILPEERRPTYEKYAIFEIAKKINETTNSCSVFNNWSYGAFLSYALLNDNKIFIDGRNTVYSRSDFHQYRNALLGQNLRQYLTHYHPCWAVLDKFENTELITQLKYQGAEEVLAENSAVLLKLRD